VSDRLYLGADPGKSGGLVLLDEAGAVVDASKMPDTETDLIDHLAEFAGQIHIAHLEAVHAFPGQGLSSSFHFGMSYGGLRMALVALHIPFEAISPQRWQRLIGVPIVQKKNKKQATRAKAQELFPASRSLTRSPTRCCWRNTRGVPLSGHNSDVVTRAPSPALAECGRPPVKSED